MKKIYKVMDNNNKILMSSVKEEKAINFADSYHGDTKVVMFQIKKKEPHEMSLGEHMEHIHKENGITFWIITSLIIILVILPFSFKLIFSILGYYHMTLPQYAFSIVTIVAGILGIYIYNKENRKKRK